MSTQKPNTFELRVNLDNAAFDIWPTAELARIMRELATKLDHVSTLEIDGHKLKGLVGNTVGMVYVDHID